MPYGFHTESHAGYFNTTRLNKEIKMGKDIFDLIIRDAIGLNGYFDRVNNLQTSTYPPHNIIQTTEDEYIIELAVAGFKQEEITIKSKESELTVSGKSKETNNGNKYIHRGLAFRDFSKTFILGDYIEVSNASIEDGLLKINLKRILPDAKKERIIKIDNVNNQNLLLG